MRVARSLTLSALLLLPLTMLVQAESLPNTPARKVSGEARPISAKETTTVVKRYRSVPGDGPIRANARPISPAESKKVLNQYNSIPGGLILEGRAGGLKFVKRVSYDAKRNTFLLNGNVTYVSPISAKSALELIDALIADDRIGVSIGDSNEIIYGKLSKDSEIALNLKLADNFLGDMILPPQDWTIGYRYADNYSPLGNPQSDVQQDNVKHDNVPQDNVPAVFFSAGGYIFGTEDGKLKLLNATFKIRTVPVSNEIAEDGGYLPDMKRIGVVSTIPDPYDINAQHVADNIGYYVREEIVNKALAYGEVASFFRVLKRSRVSMKDLRRQLKEAVGENAAATAPPQLPTLEEGWRAYLKDIQSRNQYANWSSRPYDLYLARQ